MVSLIQFEGLKCDNPACGFNDPTIDIEEYPEFIGKRCPHCGITLLTRECYDELLNIKDMVRLGYDKQAFENFAQLKYLGRSQEELDIIRR